jgi:hypothetical protein
LPCSSTTELDARVGVQAQRGDRRFGVGDPDGGESIGRRRDQPDATGRAVEDDVSALAAALRRPRLQRDFVELVAIEPALQRAPSLRALPVDRGDGNHRHARAGEVPVVVDDVDGDRCRKALRGRFGA